MAKRKKVVEEPKESPILSGTYAALNEAIKTMSEDELKELLESEKNGAKRLGFLTRIHGRYNVLRNERERRELTQDAI